MQPQGLQFEVAQFRGPIRDRVYGSAYLDACECAQMCVWVGLLVSRMHVCLSDKSKGDALPSSMIYIDQQRLADSAHLPGSLSCTSFPLSFPLLRSA